MRSAASQLLLLCCTAAVIYAETSALAVWRMQTLSSTTAMVLFVVCNLRLVWLSSRDGAGRQWLLWSQAALVVYLFLTAARPELMHVLAVFWVVRIPAMYGARTSVALVFAVVAMSLVIALARGEPWETPRVVVMVTVYGLALFISNMVEGERRLHRQTIALNRELTAAQQHLAEAAMQSERLRIARDMHDLLGHQLSAQIVNLEVASHQAEGAALPHVTNSLALGKAMLGDLRDAVRELREVPHADLPQALRRWLSKVPRLETSLDLPADLMIEDPSTVAALMRCVQEATTNTLRHAGASRFQVALRAADDQLVLDLWDNGRCPAEIVPGNGLRGMRERVEALAGRLDWQTRNGSLRLTVTLPLQRGRST